MGRCNCWEERIEYKPLHNMIGNPDVAIPYGVCLGTKEIDRCDCGGDESKCDFYPEKRKGAEKKMNTAEMWLKAQEDGKTYICNDGKTYICNSILYNKKTGLISATSLDPWPIGVFDSIDTLMESQWSLHQVEIMNKAEAEKKYGIKIVD